MNLLKFIRRPDRSYHRICYWGNGRVRDEERPLWRGGRAVDGMAVYRGRDKETARWTPEMTERPVLMGVVPSPAGWSRVF